MNAPSLYTIALHIPDDLEAYLNDLPDYAGANIQTRLRRLVAELLVEATEKLTVE